MITGAHLLAIAEAINNRVANCVTWSIPSPLKYSSKAGFWSAYNDANDTKVEIETTLIDAAWIRYLTFEDIAGEEENPREIDGPVKELVYEITVFHEATQTRLDETATPDAFNKQIRLTNHNHVTAVMELCGEFQGINPIPELAADFAVAESIALAQIEPTEDEVPCAYIPSVIGDQTKLECRIRVQLPC